MGRSQFTFYRSYYDALKGLKASDRVKIYDAVLEYVFDEKAPSLSGTVAAIFQLIKPTLDAGAKKAENRLNKTKSNEEQKKSNEEQTENKKNQIRKEKEKEREVEREIEVESEREIENEYYIISSSTTPPNPPEYDPEISETVSAFQDAFGEYLSRSAMQEIVHTWFPHFGKTVLLYAMDVAKDNGKLSWAYIRAVLMRWKQDGLTTVAEIQAEAEAREKTKSGAGGKETATGKMKSLGSLKPHDFAKFDALDISKI